MAFVIHSTTRYCGGNPTTSAVQVNLATWTPVQSDHDINSQSQHNSNTIHPGGPSTVTTGAAGSHAQTASTPRVHAAAAAQRLFYTHWIYAVLSATNKHTPLRPTHRRVGGLINHGAKAVMIVELKEAHNRRCNNTSSKIV